MVRALLHEQHPDLVELSLERLDEGWDNTLWRLGSELVVRLPRRGVAAPLVVNEQRWLPTLAALLPLPVSSPVRVGRPSAEYPWSWSVLPWLEGTPGDRAELTDPDDAAIRLASFLRALHRPAPSGAPRNPVRGVALIARASAMSTATPARMPPAWIASMPPGARPICLVIASTSSPRRRASTRIISAFARTASRSSTKQFAGKRPSW